MSASLLTGAASKAAERWVTELLTPSFAFWAGGLVAWGRWDKLQRWLTATPVTVVVAVAIGGFLLVAVSGRVVRQSTLPVLRLLEGYWPPWMSGLRRAAVEARGRRISRTEEKWNALAAATDAGDYKAGEKYTALDAELRRVPARPDRRMPTALGDILRAAESWPTDKYGLDAPKCWPRLWLVLPDSTRTILTEARSRLDDGAAIWLWGLLFLVWTRLAWWAPIVTVAVLAGSWFWMLAVAREYGDLVESAFDVHRAALYQAVGMTKPAEPAEEVQAGQALTAYLWHGTVP